MKLDAAISDWAADMRVDKSAKTISTYTEALGLFHKWAESRNSGTPDLADITAADIKGWLISLREAGRTQSTIYNRYNGLRAFCRWAVEEGLMKASPIESVAAPKVEARPIPFLSLAQLQAIIRTCANSSDGVRDEAIIRLLADTGMRRTECASLTVEAVDLVNDTATVHAKGNRIRLCPFGPKTAKALRRYLRVRPPGGTQLWIGRRGPINSNAILLMLKRRAKRAGIEERVFVHQLRHTWAHEALRAGLQEGDVMRLAGWRSREMVSRYGAAGADERARDAYRPVSLGDRL